MASREELLSAVKKLTETIATSKFVKNKRSVSDGLTQVKSKWNEVEKFKSDAKKIQINKSSPDELNSAIEYLEEVITKKISCLETMLEICSMEDEFSKFSKQFDEKSLRISQHFKNVNQQNLKIYDTNTPGFIALSAQDCIFGVQDNWTWLLELAQCSTQHLQNSSKYHQFHHEVEETEAWLDSDLKKFNAIFNRAQSNQQEEAKYLLNEIDSVYVALRQWEARISRLFHESTKIVPVPRRTEPTKAPLPAQILADYETDQIKLKGGEEVLLIKNGPTNEWTVRNSKGQEALVPSVIVLIPAPDEKIVELATKLRLQLLTSWTNLLKRVGVRAVCFTLFALQPEYNQLEIASLTSMEDLDKQRMKQILDQVEISLKNIWSDDESFVSIQERILALKMILEELEDNTNHENSTDLCKATVLKITLLGKIIDIYKDLFKDWEKFKVSVETSRSPELMLIVEKWEQLQFVGKEYFSKFWKMRLPLNENERLILKSYSTSESPNINIQMPSTQITKTERSYLIEAAPNAYPMKCEFTVDLSAVNTTRGDQQATDEHKKLITNRQTESFLETRSEKTVEHQRLENDNEEKKRVIDCTDIRTIIKPTLVKKVEESWTTEDGFHEERTVYLNQTDYADSGTVEINSSGSAANQRHTTSQRPVTRVSKLEGFEEQGMFEEGYQLKSLEWEGARASEYEATTFGMATEIKMAQTEEICSAEMEENKTFVISSVVDPVDKKLISFEQAIISGVIKPAEGVYYNPTTGVSVPISTAMAERLINVEFCTTKRGPEKFSSIGIITVKKVTEKPRPYKIVSVLDQNTGEMLSDAEASKRGLLDEKRGIYYDVKNKKRLLLSEASEGGFVKLEYSNEDSDSKPETEVKTYAVRAVVDRRFNKTVTFREAVQMGIIDRDTGAYKDTKTGDLMYIGDAIMRGFLKARVIDDTTHLNIDPRNHMIIEKTQKIKARLLRPLKIINAFKKAAASRSRTHSESDSVKDPSPAPNPTPSPTPPNFNDAPPSPVSKRPPTPKASASPSGK